MDEKQTGAPLGVEDTKKVLRFVIELGESVDKGLADGKLDFGDAGLLVSPLMLIGPALESLSGAQAELKDLTTAEMSELVTFVEDELSIRDKETEKMIEEGLSLAVRIYMFVQLFGKKDEAPAA